MARPAGGKPRRKGKKDRKIGRNKAFCQMYRLTNREAKNKARNIAREERRQGKGKAEV